MSCTTRYTTYVQTVCPCGRTGARTETIADGHAPRQVMHERRRLGIITIPPARDRRPHRQTANCDFIPQTLHWTREAFLIRSLGTVSVIPGVGVTEGRVEVAAEICMRTDRVGQSAADRLSTHATTQDHSPALIQRSRFIKKKTRATNKSTVNIF